MKEEGNYIQIFFLTPKSLLLEGDGGKRSGGSFSNYTACSLALLPESCGFITQSRQLRWAGEGINAQGFKCFICPEGQLHRGCGLRPCSLAGEATLTQCLPVVQKLVVLVQLLLFQRPLELDHVALLFDIREDGGLVATDHEKHLHGSGGLSPRFIMKYDRTAFPNCGLRDNFRSYAITF